MTALGVAMLLSLGLVSGLMIGCIGIGGVILVPALAYIGGVPIHAAIAAAMAGYILTGLVGTLVFARNKTIRWDLSGALWIGAMPAALAGALAASIAPGRWLEAVIGAATLLSGAHALASRESADETAGRTLSSSALATIGAGVGFVSALSGTGGPLTLVPLLMWLRLPVLTVIGLAQAIQLPIALLATAGNFYAGTVDLALGALLGVGLSVGTWIGARLAHSLPRRTLRSIVSIVLLVVGGAILIKITAQNFSP